MKRLLSFVVLIFLGIMLYAQEKSAIDNNKLVELLENQRYIDAANYLQSVNSGNLSDPKVLKRIGYYYLMGGALNEAERYYDQVAKLDSNNLAIQFSLATIYSRRGNTTKGIAAYKKILKADNTNFNAYKQLASLYEETEILQKLGLLRKANKLNPSDGDVAYELGEIYLKLKQFPAADSVITLAYRADTSNMILLRGQVRSKFALSKFNETIKLATKFIAMGNQNTSVTNALGQSYYNTKQYRQCIDAFRASLDGGMKNENFFYFMAMSYKKLKNYPEANNYMQQTINEALSPNIFVYYVEMADSYEASSQYKNALKAYNTALQFDTRPVVYYNIARLYDQFLKDPKSAIKYYKKYLASKPSEKTEKAYMDYAKSKINITSKQNTATL